MAELPTCLILDQERKIGKIIAEYIACVAGYRQRRSQAGVSLDHIASSVARATA